MSGRRTHDVTILTYRDFPDLYPDDALLRAALERRGAAVRAAVWDDPAVDWSASATTVFRSTWDYFETPGAFEAWLDRVESQTRLINSARLVRWNYDKSYLLDLQSRGFTCIPSAVLRAGDAPSLAALQRERDWHDIVVKPTVSGASFRTQRFRSDTAAAVEHAQRLLDEGRTVLVQPYLEEIDTLGEHAVIFIGGRYSHTVRKLPFHGIPQAGDDPEERVGIPAGFKALACRILETLDDVPAYARIDLVPTPAGPVLMELELIEPSLYFRLHPESADRLAETILAAP